MQQNYKISETEWKIMELLWDNPNQTIGDIKTALTDTGWSESTIKTLVRRLVQKGAVKADNSDGHFIYTPMVSSDVCKRKETRNFLSRIYQGSIKMMMANLASESKLTEEETNKLMEIIDKMEGGDKR
ncbi:MAG: BlaI/MecI/CopY family transcriptional regulator [Clostridia bacterium]|nr:BlaI/MecI/CopY family transcriptional regulator [Clostridia bacterium]